MRSLPRGVQVALLVLIGVAWFIGNALLDRAEKLESVTSFSRKATGLSILSDLLLAQRKVVVSGQRALLEDKDLQEFSTLILFSPLAGLTRTEVKVVKRFIEKGGTLLLSGHNELTLDTVDQILVSLHVTPPFWEDNPDFTNGNSQSVTGEEGVLTRTGEHYEFYSPYQIKGGKCAKGSLGCFAVRHRVGKGSVLVFAGLPPVGNALIGRGDNRRLAFRLADHQTPLYIDEYHHFFSDRTFWDLMREPAFGLTIVGIVLLTLLYFLFGHTEFHERTLRPESKRAPRSFEDLSENLTFAALFRDRNYRSALELQMASILRRFPKDRAALNQELAGTGAQQTKFNQRTFLRAAEALVALHRRWLIKRGRTP